MIRRLLACLVLPAFAWCAADAENGRSLSNLDFEQGAVGEVPLDWIVRSAVRYGYRVVISDERPHGGARSGLIQRDSAGSYRDAGVIGKKIDARPYRGKRVMLTGWARYAGPPGLPYLGAVQMYLRVDRPRDLVGFFDNMGDHPVRSAEWTECRIVGEVAADADTVAFGAFLTASGRGWVDDFSLRVLGNAGEGNQPPRPVSEIGVENLVAFARLLGYVRHFHPADAAATADWESFTIAGVDEVEKARNPAQLAATLETLFHPLAPTVRIATRRPSPLEPASLRPAATSPVLVRGWWHYGWGGPQPNYIYYDRRPLVPVDSPGDSVLPIGSEVNVPLGGGVWASVPLTVYADSSGTLPRSTGAPARPRRPEGWISSGEDRASRLAAVLLFWNVAQHFYPYFDVIQTDWQAQLPIALRRAATNDGAAFQVTLERLVAALHDGHGTVNSSYAEFRSVPVEWRLLEGRLVVTGADSSAANRVHPGDEVIAIDGRPVSERIRKLEPQASGATRGYVNLQLARSLLKRNTADSISLDLRSPSGARRHERLARGREVRPARPDSVAELRSGVFYLDLDRITDQDFQRELPRLAEAKGLVFDLRGYPNRISPVMLAHLIDSTITCARWNVPVVTRPDRENMQFHFSNWTVEPLTPRIHARTAFLIDARAISYSETILGMVEHYRLAELVGEPTAGTNGNIVIQRLPGGFNVIFTGMKVLKHDGSRHHGVGIRPTVPITPTIAGIAAGRDEQLEKAIEVVLGRAGGRP